MDHCIDRVKSYMQSTIDMYQDFHVPKKDIEAEIQAYVDAIGKLEVYYYGERKTSLDAVLASYK